MGIVSNDANLPLEDRLSGDRKGEQNKCHRETHHGSISSGRRLTPDKPVDRLSRVARSHLSSECCQLIRSTQHLFGAHSQESRILRSFSDVDSSAARPVELRLRIARPVGASREVLGLYEGRRGPAVQDRVHIIQSQHAHCCPSLDRGAADMRQ
jgi:hypothetical protein